MSGAITAIALGAGAGLAASAVGAGALASTAIGVGAGLLGYRQATEAEKSLKKQKGILNSQREAQQKALEDISNSQETFKEDVARKTRRRNEKRFQSSFLSNESSPTLLTGASGAPISETDLGRTSLLGM